MANMEPIAEKLVLPAEYGTVKATLAWATVRERLEQAAQYWFVTIRKDGRPHVVPVDGLWLDDAWYYGGSPATAHQHNVQRDPRAVIHLDDPAAAVVVEGVLERQPRPMALARRLAAASKAKYGYGPSPELYAEGVWELRPQRARAWSNFPTDATRFVFS
jgi:Pyridoxamine 5'-phosphate oxidase